MAADPLVPWVLTYLIHSTLLLAVAWCTVRLWRSMPLSLQESLWRTALLGGVLTATGQLALGLDPWSGQLALPRPDQPVAEIETMLPSQREVAVDEPVVPRVATPPSARSVAATSASRSLDPTVPLGALWALVFTVLCVRHRRARGRLQARLATRAPVQDPALRASVPVRIRLSTTDDLHSPIAIGIARPEIVLPSRACSELTPPQREAMLAHELAHHVRRDPLWFAAIRVVTGVLFFQPLNHLARRRLRETSELLCDTWAAEHTGRAGDLADCLATVAGWRVHGARSLAVPAMAAEGSMLERRVERLLQDDPPRRVRASARVFVLLPLAAVAVFAPVVAIRASADGARSEPLEVDAATAPLAALDAELTDLRSEAEVLLALLARIPNPPEALRQGAARLGDRIAALEARRAALLSGTKER